MLFSDTVRPHHTYKEAVKALNTLYSSRTGNAYEAYSIGDSEEERVSTLCQGIYEEKIWPILRDVLRIETLRRNGRYDPVSAGQLQSAEMANAIAITAEICLSNPEGEIRRRGFADFEAGSAHYDINTNEKLPYGVEDLFLLITQMERRFVWDVNSKLPSEFNSKHAFIVGQTFDHEDCFWRRPEVKGGRENIFNFGLADLFGQRCLQIQRIRKGMVTVLNKLKMAKAADHFSSEHWTMVRQGEVRVILGRCSLGEDWLDEAIADLRPSCEGNYFISIEAARCCAARLLLEKDPKLNPKIDEEWEKFKKNHRNVLGDTRLIQNALYLNAEVLTKDEGAKRMARYCGLQPVNELLVPV